MILDIIFTLIFFGLGSFQGWCMARRSMRKELGPAIELADAYNHLSQSSKDHINGLIDKEAASDA